MQETEIIADLFGPRDETSPNVETSSTMMKHNQHSSHSTSSLFQTSDPKLNAAAAVTIDGAQPIPGLRNADSPITLLNSYATKITGVDADDLHKIVIKIIKKLIHITDHDNVRTKTRTWDLFFPFLTFYPKR